MPNNIQFTFIFENYLMDCVMPTIGNNCDTKNQREHMDADIKLIY